MQMQFAHSCSSPRVESHTTEAVAVDVLGTMGWCKGANYVRGRLWTNVKVQTVGFLLLTFWLCSSVLTKQILPL